jgi:hypothetical protein
MVLRAAIAVTAALAAVSCGTVPVPSGHREQAPPAGRAGQRGVIPWVSQPGRIIWPRPLPRHFVPATALPCTAAGLRVFPAGGNGATGHTEFTLGLRDISRTACLLKGYPHVVATQPGRRDVVAADGGYMVGRERAGDMPPGGVTWLNLETDRDCPARYANPGRYPTLVYHAVTVSIRGCGLVIIHQPFDVLCGLFTGQFAVTGPPQRSAQPPWAGVRAGLELPAPVAAGSVLRYVADLTSPAGKPMRLSPCPGYFGGIGVAGKTVLELNCAAVPGRQLPAHQTVRFAMQLPVPAGTPTGPARVGWSIAGPVTAYAHGSVRVIGHDIPCTAAQLGAAITGPGQVPGPPTVLGMKGLATAVPLTVTNVSGTPCSVYGAPDVAIRAAGGRNLELSQVSYLNLELPPSRPVPRVIILGPRTGTARTTLYWYLPWCRADPNPVTVLVTLPANGARLAATPGGGWTPPPCRGGTPPRSGSPGEVSAGPFRAG